MVNDLLSMLMHNKFTKFVIIKQSGKCNIYVDTCTKKQQKTFAWQ